MHCSGVGVFAGSLLQMLLQKIGQSTGDYPLALAGKCLKSLFMVILAQFYSLFVKYKVCLGQTRIY